MFRVEATCPSQERMSAQGPSAAETRIVAIRLSRPNLVIRPALTGAAVHRPEAAIGKVWWSWFEGGSTDTILRKIMSVAGVFDIEVVVAHLLLVPAPDSTAARVSSNTKTPYKWDASSV